jgi:hypothetical protein
MVATNKQISTSITASPPGLGISNCSIPSSVSSGNFTFSFPSPAGTTINPTSCTYANGDTVYLGPGFVFGGNNIMFYSLNPWGDPSNTAVNSLPYSLGSSNTNSSTGTVFTSNANQYFGNEFSLTGSAGSTTGTNILFVPYTDSSTGLQKLGAIKFFLYSPYTTDSYIYNEMGPLTGTTKTYSNNTNIPYPVTYPYSGYTGYLYAYYDPLNIDIAKSPSEFNEVALPTGYTPFMFDSQNFPSSNGSVPSGNFCFQTWSATNNVMTNEPSGTSYYQSSTTMENPITGTTYQLFGAVPINFADATTNYFLQNTTTNANVTTSVTYSGTTTLSAISQYNGNATYTSTSGVGGTPFCSGTLIVGSYLNTSSTLSTFFGTSNLTSDQQNL